MKEVVIVYDDYRKYMVEFFDEKESEVCKGSCLGDEEGMDLMG